MSISDTTKIDKAFKFVSGKGYTSTIKSIDGEDASSGFIIGTSSIFLQDAGIPTTAPGASTAILTYYPPTTRFVMTADISSPLNHAWYASTDPTNLTTVRATRQTNWVPVSFGNYTIRMFLTNGSNTSTPLLEIFFSDQTNPQFDYKTGILTFEQDPIQTYASLSPTGIQISGYRYTGPLLNSIFDANGNFAAGLSDPGGNPPTSLAEFIGSSKTFTISSPHAINSTWVLESPSNFAGISPSVVEWRSIFQMPNGQLIASGGDTSNTKGFIAYSYGTTDILNHSWTIAVDGVNNLNPIHSLHAIWSADGRTVWAGASGTGVSSLASSINGGLDWQYAADPAFAIEAIWGSGSSATNFYLVGAAGVIKHTTNGTSFPADTNADSNTLRSVNGSSAANIFAVGDNGAIRHSTGSGTWTGQTSGTANNLTSVFALSSVEVYAVGASGTVLHSTDSATWSAFNIDASTGLAFTSQLAFSGVWGTSAGGLTRVYLVGYHSGTATANTYFLDTVPTSPTFHQWILQQATITIATTTYGMAGGPNGVYVGLNQDFILALHENPALRVQGNTLVDGYMNVGLDLRAKSIKVERDLSVGINYGTGGSTTAVNIHVSKQGANLTNAAFLPKAISIFSDDAGSTNNYTVLTAASNDTGEGFRLWRESPTVYTLDLGSKTSNLSDGVTPFASGGRIRLGGFSTSPSTTARGEIETVTSAALRVFARQSDLNLGTTFGTSGSSLGNVNITTVNGQINITAGGSGSPTHAGEIIVTPGANQSVFTILSTDTTSSSFRTQSPSGNYNIMYGDGTFINNGGITTPSVSNTGNLTVSSGSAQLTLFHNAGFNLQTAAGQNSYILWGNTDSTSTFRTQGVSGAYNILYANGNFENSGNVRAQEAAVYLGLNSDGGYGVQVASGGFVYCPWGLGNNPAASNTYFDTCAAFGCRFATYSSATVSYNDNTHANIDTLPYVPNSGSFRNSYGVLLEWHSTTGAYFTYFGTVLIH